MKVGSKFKLNIKTELSSADFKVLAFLYQPLIGKSAHSVYCTFYHLSKSKLQLTHQTFFDMINTTELKFKIMREKLEAIGLLETYENDKSDTIYVLKPPYSAKKFLTETFLGAYLESEIGSKNLKALAELFKVESDMDANFVNVTKSFDDLYHFKSKELLSINFDLEERNGNNTKMIKNGINYYEFVEKLPRALKSPQLFNENFKQKLIQLAYVYQFSISDLIKVYEKASVGKSDPSFENISFQAKNYYESLNKEIMVSRNELSEEEVLNNVPFIQIIEKYSGEDVYLRASALDTVNDFINQNEIMQGTLNVLLIFILKNKNGVLPHVNYLNKVWRSWAKKGVKTASDAIKLQKEIEANYKPKYKQKAPENDWVDSYLDELEQMEG